MRKFILKLFFHEINLFYFLIVDDTVINFVFVLIPKSCQKTVLARQT